MADVRVSLCRHCGQEVRDDDRYISPGGGRREHGDPPTGCVFSLIKRVSELERAYDNLQRRFGEHVERGRRRY